MTTHNALTYFRNISYNHQLWNQRTPIRMTWEGKRYFGYLLNHDAPFQILLTQILNNGSARHIQPITLTLPQLDGYDVAYLYHHHH